MACAALSHERVQCPFLHVAGCGSLGKHWRGRHALVPWRLEYFTLYVRYGERRNLWYS